MRPEFARPERVDTIGEEARTVRIAAGEAERAALAARFGLLGIATLDGDFSLKREGADILVTGRVTAAVTQACAVSGEPLDAKVDEPVALRFVPEPDADPELDGEIELGADALDTLPIEGGAIDLGEAAAETLALAIDPFARSAEADDLTAGIRAGPDAGPFAALAALKGKLPG